MSYDGHIGWSRCCGAVLGPPELLLSPVVNALHWGKVQEKYVEGHLALLLRELKRVKQTRKARAVIDIV